MTATIVTGFPPRSYTICLPPHAPHPPLRPLASVNAVPTYPPAVPTSFPPTALTYPAAVPTYPPAVPTSYPPATPTYPPAVSTSYPPAVSTPYPPAVPTSYPPAVPTNYPPAFAQPSLESPRPLARSIIDWEHLWRQLMTARVRFRSALWMEGKCVVVFRRTEPTLRQFSLTSREQAIFLRTLRGERQKQIASDCRIATSTVANCFKSAIDKLGFNTRLDTAPLAALVLSHASERGSLGSTGSIYSISNGDYLLAHAPHPHWGRFPQVTASERQIADLIIEGRSNAHIARMRQTSVHTVENQVASLFRKLKASGRFDFLRVLYRPGPPPLPALERAIPALAAHPVVAR